MGFGSAKVKRIKDTKEPYIRWVWWHKTELQPVFVSGTPLISPFLLLPRKVPGEEAARQSCHGRPPTGSLPLCRSAVAAASGGTRERGGRHGIGSCVHLGSISCARCAEEALLQLPFPPKKLAIWVDLMPPLNKPCELF